MKNPFCKRFSWVLCLNFHQLWFCWGNSLEFSQIFFSFIWRTFNNAVGAYVISVTILGNFAGIANLSDFTWYFIFLFENKISRYCGHIWHIWSDSNFKIRPILLSFWTSALQNSWTLVVQFMHDDRYDCLIKNHVKNAF